MNFYNLLEEAAETTSGGWMQWVPIIIIVAYCSSRIWCGRFCRSAKSRRIITT